MDLDKKIVIDSQKLARHFSVGDITVKALDGVNFQIEAGEFVSIMGSSGSGKSTLMNLLGCLDQPTSGKYILDGVDVSSISSNAYSEIRNRSIGFVFQGFNLLSRTTALENVQLPLLYCRNKWFEDPKEEAKKALDRVGLSDRMDHVPSQLSGGQQQRVAIARALVNRPALILADEPTGNLDTLNSWEIMSLFQELNREGVTIVVVTHEVDIAECSKRLVELKDGEIIRDELVKNQRDAAKEVEAVKKNRTIDTIATEE